MPAMRALTVTTTKLRQNMMWAIRIAVWPSGMRRLRNSVSSDEPITTSGVAIGMKMSRLVAERPRNRCRPRANAISVPSAVEAIVATRPILRLSPSESHMPAALQGCSHASRENLFQV